MNRPNVIFFFTDQQRWDTAGCYGQPLNVTPHLDALAKEGVVFEEAYTAQPVCG
ncbi:MAG: sulfatase-like hydrolase/transferase, partial [Hungatella sp.]